jgi:hypothetical protein
MSIPQWNSEWEKPDPLRGARGWSGHHYATVGAAVALLITSVGMLMPAVPRARYKERDVDRAWEQLNDAFARAAEDTSPRAPRDPSEGDREAPAVKTRGPLTFTDSENRFSVIFPEAPVLRSRSTAANVQAQLAVWEAHDGDTTYTLTAIYAPVELLDATFDLDQMSRGGGDPHWRVVSRRAVTIDGLPGKQVEYSASAGNRTSVSVSTRFEGTVVTMTISRTVGLTGESEEAKASFDSLRFAR